MRSNHQAVPPLINDMLTLIPSVKFYLPEWDIKHKNK